MVVALTEIRNNIKGDTSLMENNEHVLDIVESEVPTDKVKVRTSNSLVSTSNMLCPVEINTQGIASAVK